MQHLAGYYSLVDQGNTLLPLAGIQDQALLVTGNDIRVPVELPNLAGGMLLTGATTITSAQFQAPSLRDTFYPSIAPLAASIIAGNPPQLVFNPSSPIPLVALEDLNLYSNTDAAAAVSIYGLAWFQDGPQQPIQGAIRTIRAVASSALSVGAWVNSNLVFDQVLPVGDYQVVGMRVEGANLTAARLVFQGYAWRPGVSGTVNASNVDSPNFRYGMGGLMGTFNNNVPPTLDALGQTDTSQVVYLDLIKVG